MFTTRPELVGTFGAAASTHWLASQVSMSILERGGNAFDGAVAGGFMLQLCEPHMNGPAGDVPLIIYSAEEEQARVICGQGPTPAAATREKYEELGIEVIPGTGLLAACVPGAFDAWMLMLRDYGKMSLREVLEPTIEYAEKGCPITASPAGIIGAAAEMIDKHWPSTAAIYLKDGKGPKAGDFYTNPQLAKTWRRVIEDAEGVSSDRIEQIDAARDIWAEGFIAEAMVEFSQGEPHYDQTGKKNNGLLVAEDLKNWRASYDEPVSIDYHGHTILKCGPWSQGPVQLQALSLLKDAGLADMDPVGSKFVHTVIEAMKLAYADREAFYGDPDYVDVPMEVLFSEEYISSRRQLMGGTASLDFRPGLIEGYGFQFDYEAALDRVPEDNGLVGFGGGEPTMAKLHKGDTCHLDVIDKWGNMVSATPSGGWLQSSPAIPELGFCLGTRTQMMWMDEESPSVIGPKKRPRTTLTPSMALKNGKPYLAYGTPGGDQQDQWQLIMILRHIHHGMNLQEAIDCPSFHSEHFPSSFYPRHAQRGRLVMEGRFDAKVVEELRELGHDVVVGDDWSEGRLSAASWDDGVIKTAANPRGMQGYAVCR
ncbi:gamma-glutamyltransferase family protein [Curvivirga sp.]|uniref:gamma-glutamyltransferase family protein n=1 Tax=Curvivirga sp. TaxID=2856848 RepID=UPI003B5BB1A6